MPNLHFALFNTALGTCGIAWGESGIVGAQLPEGDAARTRARLLRRFLGVSEAVPPPQVVDAIAAIKALFAGGADDLSHVALDMSGVPDFDRNVYEEARKIPPGATLTYGGLAERIGAPGAAQAVGRALARNPFAPIVPCHRIAAAGARIGGFSAVGGVATKRRLLAIESTHATDQPLLSFASAEGRS